MTEKTDNRSQQKRRVRTFELVEFEVNLNDMFHERMGDLLFKGEAVLMLQGLHQKNIRFEHTAKDLSYIARRAGDDFARRVHALREQRDQHLNDIVEELIKMRKEKRKVPHTDDVYPEFVSWVKSIGLKMFSDKQNPRWKHGDQSGNFLAIFAPFQMVLHSVFTVLCTVTEHKVTDETRANARDLIPRAEMKLIQLEERIEQQVKKGEPQMAEFPDDEEGVEMYMVAVNMYKNELSRDRRTRATVRRSIEFLEEKFLREKKEADDNPPAHKAAESDSGDRVVFSDSDMGGMVELFHALNIPEDNYVESLKRLSSIAVKRDMPPLFITTLDDLKGAAVKLYDLAVVKKIDVSDELKKAVGAAKGQKLAEMKRAKSDLTMAYKYWLRKATASVGSAAAVRK